MEEKLFCFLITDEQKLNKFNYHTVMEYHFLFLLLTVTTEKHFNEKY